MHPRRAIVSALALSLVGFPTSTLAQSAEPASATGLRKELIQQLDDAEKKFVALAQAMPDAKYGWRPAAGVRSVGEVYMHIVGANFMLPGLAGVKRVPEVTLPRDMETSITDKGKIVDLLHKAFSHAKQGVMDVPDDQMDATVNLFGQTMSKRGVLVLMTTHAHEHLGQSIAYARTNGVIPPWSQNPRAGSQ